MKVPALSGNSELNFKRNIQFKDIFDLDEIQKLQDIFSEANQVASIISHPDGTPITKQSNFCKLCLMVIKKTENGGENCMKADSAFCAKGANGLSIGNCINSGLTNAVTRILVGGQHVANWVIGQVRTEQIDPQQIYQYADRLGIEREEFIKAWTEI
ncbi:MAG: histidine kinase, partial [Chloroflexi bacterium HGW-Chloroflexi-5]